MRLYSSTSPLLIVALFAGACAGAAVQSDQVRRITPGVTTQREVQTWFGAPTSQSLAPDQTTWYYERRTLVGADTAASAAYDISSALGLPMPSTASTVLSDAGTAPPDTWLEVHFDARGVVTTYQYSGR